MSPADRKRLDAIIVTRNRRLEQERDTLRLALKLTVETQLETKHAAPVLRMAPQHLAVTFRAR